MMKGATANLPVSQSDNWITRTGFDPWI